MPTVATDEKRVDSIEHVTPSESSPPEWCVDVIQRFRARDGRSAEHAARLAQKLAESGEVLQRDSGSADVASTGGPASLTTFLPPLILAADGVRVPKIGVPGRPAGVIDTFGALPGYKTSLSRAEFEKAILESGFGNTLSTGVFAPDDSVLFRSRQRLDAQNVPGLVVASLLSKKLAAGLVRVVFDVRTMTGGNFGNDEAEAQANIDLLQETSALVGIDSHCVISESRAPSQPMLGRAEALRGVLALLDRKASPWLERHFGRCVMLAELASEKSYREHLDRDAMRSALDAHLQSQGAEGVSAAENYLAQIERTHPQAVLTAPRDGRLSWSVAGLRTAIVDNQSGSDGRVPGGFSDACGVELLREEGDFVEAGGPVARVRGLNLAILRKTMGGVSLSLTVTSVNRDSNDGGPR